MLSSEIQKLTISENEANKHGTDMYVSKYRIS